MFMILCVLDQVDQLKPVLKAWEKNGITGVTVLESTGMHRLVTQPRIPMRYTFGASAEERGNFTLFTVVEAEEDIRRCLEATESVVGDFNDPDTGIFLSWPLGFSKGIKGKQRFSGGV